MERWTNSSIGAVCDVIAGQSPKGTNYNDLGEGLPFYQGKKEFGEKCIGPPTTWTTQITREACAGDILMSVRAPVGPINLATERICIGRGLAAIRSGEQINRDFLFSALLSMQDQIQGHEGAVFSSINKKQIECLPFSYPSLPEQKRIVAILDEAFAAIATATANAEKNLANARELFESQLSKIFRNHSPTEDGRDSGHAMMEEWRSVPLAECIQHVATPVKIPRKQFEDSGQFPIVSQEKELINGFWSDESAVIPVESPLVVFGDHTQVLKYIDFDFIVGADGVKLLQPKSFLNAKYFYYFLMANPIAKLGYARHYRLLKELDINFPQSLLQQERIVERLDRLCAEKDTLVGIYAKKIICLTELKQSLLHKAFTGELTAQPNQLEPDLP